MGWQGFHCPGERIRHAGALWDLLQFMQQAKNFTFTMVAEGNYEWGTCYGVNNCTGMVGMVTRKEVDFALGKNLAILSY